MVGTCPAEPGAKVEGLTNMAIQIPTFTNNL